MPFIKLQFRPGINRDQTNYSNEGGWYDSEKIRFRSGYPEKIGGWVKYTPTAFLGVCRQLFNWITKLGDNFLALGTNRKVYIEAGGNFYDITPLRDTNPTYTTPDTDNCITATNNSSSVLIVITGCDVQAGNYVDISGATAVGGISATVLNSTHEIATVVNVNAFTIVVDATATSTATGGGTSIEVSFEIDVGNPNTTFGYGWGTGTWSRGSWGLGSTEPIYLQQRDWWFDNFDDNLVMNIRNGPIYYWERGTTVDPTVALSARAILLSDVLDAADVPDTAMQVLLSQNDKHLLALGCTEYGTSNFDPMLVRWASQNFPQFWTPGLDVFNPDGLTLSTAGFVRLSRGSQIIRGMPARQEILIWTDTTLYSLQFTGIYPEIFAPPQELADNISIIGPRACISANNITYWMGQDKFYAYSGRVETLPCTLRNYIFQDINYNQTDQIICGTNEGFNEIWWFYPSKESNWNDRYVIYNHLERVWYYGTIERTAWLDTALRSLPQAAATSENSTSGYLYNHEFGVNDDNLPMTSYIQSSDFDLSDGDNFMLTKRIIPDLNFNGTTANSATVTMQIRPRNFPGSSFQADTADSQPVVETAVDQYTNQVFIRARARQMALKIISEDLGVQWQLGNPRLDARPDGQR